MQDLSPTLSLGFAYYFDDFQARVQALASDLTEAEFWGNPFPYGTSIGHLVLHLTGNLNYYIGAQLADTGYVRDREREFSEAQPPTKGETIEALVATIATVKTVLATQVHADWATAYRAVGVDDVPDRFSIFLRCAIHFHHHIGQMGYTKEEWLRRRG